ncbi:16S rRNA (cytidine(1402)-2'-O)-methyltransferase [Bacillus sp. 2205SS5-2]|uniref:16S rRNA (cytidine(1402)-2'-O)-methyltransferase n=1 Tax=Bacillus sp. 2205SS5-2 TaxID=3109031 RepID=UPI00300429ED
MNIQKSFHKDQEGELYLVPTPIGNLEDMTFRAINTMKKANWIAAEDTRNTKKLCNYFEIQTPTMSYHEHNKNISGEKILEKLRNGDIVALVSDAGMPCLSDPGYEIVQEALAEGHAVIPLPGANAAVTALIASGINPQPFYFFGFLARGKKEKKEQLENLKKIGATLIFYESPHRLKDTLQHMNDILGNRQIVLCRELTKKFEEFIRGSLEEVINWAEETEIRGEFCIIVEEGEIKEDQEIQWWESLSLIDHIEHYIQSKELKSKEAIKQVAIDRKLPKREVYQAYHVE